MSAAINPKDDVRGWVRKAEVDFSAVRILMATGKDCPAEAVCFHAQQCVEKYLKAILCFLGRDFPFNHDIGELSALLPPSVSIPITIQEQDQLTAYAVDSRYPDPEKEIGFTEAAGAARWMESTRSALRNSLPGDVL